MQKLHSLLETGGPVVAILLALSVVALAIVLLKAWQFTVRNVGRHGAVRDALAIWLHGNRPQAMMRLERRSGPAAMALLHAMRGSVDDGALESRVREDVERVAAEQLHGLRAGLRGLDAIAQVAPLLGLFGTVLGMITAFQDLQSAGASVDPSQLAGGIWVALLTTAVGLAVAIPTSLFLTWFEGCVENEQAFMESTLTGFFTGRLTDADRHDVRQSAEPVMEALPHAH